MLKNFVSIVVAIILIVVGLALFGKLFVAAIKFAFVLFLFYLFCMAVKAFMSIVGMK